ncbi:fungal-specific transcription factor domain-containing protein [Xylogone sp. PMI_703]|nr:fungal-specific transcription factor domain-containing protein [Xylogone sp. PMI_703]
MLTNDSWSVLPGYFEDDQASLLMHFFDHVLPLQFRFYNPSIREGGRGWLLSILTRAKPLYHVALSLAAYHQQSVLVQGSGIECATSLAKLQERHIECIKALRCHIEALSIETQANSHEVVIEVMACITFLIALELFRGDTNDWQMHLQVASTLSINLEHDQMQTATLSNTHKLALRFFTGVIAWYDILSCASTGRKPFSKSNVNESHHIHFDKIMGCENWLMDLILKIAELDEWKRSSEANGTLSMWRLVHQAADIKEQLDSGLVSNSEYSQRSESMNTIATPVSPNSSQPLVRIITQIFAGAALVYLQVIISGPHPRIPEIRHAVSRTMTAIEALPNKDFIRNLLWPVCIAGCMATEEQEFYWRDLLSTVSYDKWSFGYPSNVLRIMEECWRLRKCQQGAVLAVDWMTAMKDLNIRVLLV